MDFYYTTAYHTSPETAVDLLKDRHQLDKWNKDFTRVDEYRRKHPEISKQFPDDKRLAHAIWSSNKEHYVNTPFESKVSFERQFLLGEKELPEITGAQRAIKSILRTGASGLHTITQAATEMSRWVDGLKRWPAEALLKSKLKEVGEKYDIPNLGDNILDYAELQRAAREERENYVIATMFGTDYLGLEMGSGQGEYYSPTNSLELYKRQLAYHEENKDSALGDLTNVITLYQDNANANNQEYLSTEDFLRRDFPGISDGDIRKILSDQARGRRGDSLRFKPSVKTSYGPSYMEAVMNGDIEMPLFETLEFTGKEVLPFVGELFLGGGGFRVAFNKVPDMFKAAPRWLDTWLDRWKKTSPSAVEKAAETTYKFVSRKATEAAKFTGRQVVRGIKQMPEATAAGEFASQLTFDPYEERLVNMLPEFMSKDEYFASDVVNYLTAKEGEDSEAEARVKMALENLIIYPLGVAAVGAAGGTFKTGFEVLKGFKAITWGPAEYFVQKHLMGKTYEQIKKTQHAKLLRKELEATDMDTLSIQFGEKEWARNLSYYWLNFTNPRGYSTPYMFDRYNRKVYTMKAFERQLFDLSNDINSGLNRAVRIYRKKDEKGLPNFTFKNQLYKITGEADYRVGMPKLLNYFLSRGKAGKVKGPDGKVLPKEEQGFTLDDQKILDSLPEELQKLIIRTRKQIDELSAQIMKSPNVSSEVKAIIEKNIGEYIRKAYRVFDDPNYSVDETKRNNAIEWLKSVKGLGSSDAKKFIDDLIDNEGARNSFFNFSSKFDKLHKEIFKRKKDWDPKKDKAWLDFLSEIDDPRYNVVNTLHRMRGFIENDKFLMDIMADGQKAGYFIKEQDWLLKSPKDKKRFDTQLISGKNEKVSDYGPLEGFYTSKHMKWQLDELLELNPKIFTRGSYDNWVQSTLGWIYQAALFSKGIVNWNMTIGNNITHERNFLAGPAFMLANGNLPIGIDGWRSFATISNQIKKMPDKLKNEYYKKLMRLGIINTEVRANELNQIFSDLSGSLFIKSGRRVQEKILDMAKKRFGKGNNRDLVEAFKDIDKVPGTRTKWWQAPTDLYMAEDDIWKIFSFTRELDVLKKAYPNPHKITKNMTEKEIKAAEKLNAKHLAKLEEEAASIVKNTIQNYHYIPPFIKELRKSPLWGVFFSFPTEVLRTSFNIFKQATKELDSNNPLIVNKGIKRMAGGATVIGVGGNGLSEMSRWMLGITDEQEAAIRENNRADYSKHSPHFYTISADGKLLAQDLGYFDPYYYARKPLYTAFVEYQEGVINNEEFGKTLSDIVWKSGFDLLEPYLGTPLATQLAYNMVDGKTPDGKQVMIDYDPGGYTPLIFQSEGDNFGRWLQAVIEGGFLPRTIPNLQRVYKAMVGERKSDGSTYDLDIELTANLFGVRRNEIDPEKGFSYRISSLNSEVEKINSNISRLLTPTNNIEDFLTEYERLLEAKFVATKRMARSVDAAMVLNVDMDTIKSTLADINISKIMQDRLIYQNAYFPDMLLSSPTKYENFLNAFYPDRDTIPPDIVTRIEELEYKYIGRTMLGDRLFYRHEYGERPVFEWETSTEFEKDRKEIRDKIRNIKDWEKRKPKTTGGLVSGPDVPQTKENPADRINRVTGEPYQEQMDRLGFAEG